MNVPSRNISGGPFTITVAFRICISILKFVSKGTCELTNWAQFTFIWALKLSNLEIWIHGRLFTISPITPVSSSGHSDLIRLVVRLGCVGNGSDCVVTELVLVVVAAIRAVVVSVVFVVVVVLVVVVFVVVVVVGMGSQDGTTPAQVPSALHSSVLVFSPWHSKPSSQTMSHSSPMLPLFSQINRPLVISG